MRDYTRKWPVAQFVPPKGVVQATIDAWLGGQPGPWTRATTTEWFKSGTQPGGAHEIDPAGLLYSSSCRGWAVDPVKAELGPAAWKPYDQAWVDRARGGAGVTGPLGSTTAYFTSGSWGGPLIGSCSGSGGGPGNNGPKPPHKRPKHRRAPRRRRPQP